MSTGIIRSILDTDLYKLTMQKAILRYKPGVPVQYKFNNRRKEGKFNADFLAALQREIHTEMAERRLTDDEAEWLSKTIPWIGEDYISYLANYRFNPDQLSVRLTDGELGIDITGPWEETILWEVPLMAVISELYFKHCDTNWKYDEADQRKRAEEKGFLLSEYPFTDFGTRRRRSFETQDLIVSVLKEFMTPMGKRGLNGTSNVYLAKKYGLKPIGTMAHEWIMGVSALEGLRHANRHALRIWSQVYDGNLGIALPDTFGTAAFFEDFDGYLARLFDGVRHDSGDPYEFGEKVVAHYQKLRINPMHKHIWFTDGLDVQQAMMIANHFQFKINVGFGIGTNLTNDFPGSKPLNMVIKLVKCGGTPVVKLSDTPTKAIGDRDALRVARWTFFNTPLDA